MLFLFTSKPSQLSVENAIANSATATMADIVARDRVTAEQGIFFVRLRIFLEMFASQFFVFQIFFIYFTVNLPLVSGKTFFMITNFRTCYT